MKKVFFGAIMVATLSACANMDITGEGRVNGSDIIGDGSPVAGVIAAGALVGI